MKTIQAVTIMSLLAPAFANAVNTPRGTKQDHSPPASESNVQQIADALGLVAQFLGGSSQTAAPSPSPTDGPSLVDYKSRLQAVNVMRLVSQKFNQGSKKVVRLARIRKYLEVLRTSTDLNACNRAVLGIEKEKPEESEILLELLSLFKRNSIASDPIGNLLENLKPKDLHYQSAVITVSLPHLTREHYRREQQLLNSLAGPSRSPETQQFMTNLLVDPKTHPSFRRTVVNFYSNVIAPETPDVLEKIAFQDLDQVVRSTAVDKLRSVPNFKMNYSPWMEAFENESNESVRKNIIYLLNEKTANKKDIEIGYSEIEALLNYFESLSCSYDRNRVLSLLRSIKDQNGRIADTMIQVFQNATDSDAIRIAAQTLADMTLQSEKGARMFTEVLESFVSSPNDHNFENQNTRYRLHCSAFGLSRMRADDPDSQRLIITALKHHPDLAGSLHDLKVSYNGFEKDLIEALNQLKSQPNPSPNPSYSPGPYGAYSNGPDSYKINSVLKMLKTTTSLDLMLQEKLLELWKASESPEILETIATIFRNIKPKNEKIQIQMAQILAADVYGMLKLTGGEPLYGKKRKLYEKFVDRLPLKGFKDFSGVGPLSYTEAKYLLMIKVLFDPSFATDPRVNEY